MRRYTIRPLWLQAFAVLVTALFAYVSLLVSLPRLVLALVLLLDRSGLVAITIDARVMSAGELFGAAVGLALGVGMAALSVALFRQPYEVRVSNTGEITIVRLLTRSTIRVRDIRRIEQRRDDDQLRLAHGDRTTRLDLEVETRMFVRHLQKLNPEIVLDDL